MGEVDRSTCCYMETELVESACNEDAEWVIYSGPSPDDSVHACDLHVWKLIKDAPRHLIDSLSEPRRFTLYTEVADDALASERVWKALVKYGDHLTKCRTKYGGSRCNCGYAILVVE